MNAVTVLEKSIADIEKGSWVCGELCSISNLYTATKKSETKLMACAVGLVALFAGHTRASSYTLQNGRTLKFREAIYPAQENAKGQKINKAGRQALEFLYLAIPKKDRPTLEQYTLEDGVIEHTAQSASISTLEGAVVSYNDGQIAQKRVPSKSALAWFNRALKLASKDLGVGVSPKQVEVLTFA